VIATGPGPAAAAAAAERAVAEGAGLLISCGSAGGLIDCQPGQIIIGSAVIVGSENKYVFKQEVIDFISSFLSSCGLIETGLVASPGHALTEPEAKRALHRDTGALSVDMESGAIAEVAARAGIGCAAVRVVLDPVGARVPAAAVAGMDGARTRIGPVLAGLVKSPRDLPDTLRLARGAATVRTTLRCCARKFARLPDDWPGNQGP